MFTFKIYGKHENQNITDDGVFYFTPRSEEWFKFDMTINTEYTIIVSMEAYVLFDGDNPIECTMINLSDGRIKFAVNKHNTFKSNYSEFIKCAELEDESKTDK